MNALRTLTRSREAGKDEHAGSVSAYPPLLPTHLADSRVTAVEPLRAAAIEGRRPQLDGGAIARAITRIAHEIVERHPAPDPLVLVGMRTRGVPIAERLSGLIRAIDGRELPAGAIDISLYRDDLASRGAARIQPSRIPVGIDGAVVVLADDVLYTGRSIRAALDALIDYGRPAAIELAVLVDRGHRELPIRPDYVGKNLPTRRGDDVRVQLEEIDGEDSVAVIPGIGGRDAG